MIRSTLHPSVIAAGDRASENMLNASICKSLGTIGGGQELDDYLAGVTENRDIVEAYVEGRICCVEGLYLAMKRAGCTLCGGTGVCETELYEGLVNCWRCYPEEK